MPKLEAQIKFNCADEGNAAIPEKIASNDIISTSKILLQRGAFDKKILFVKKLHLEFGVETCGVFALFSLFVDVYSRGN